MSKTSNNFMVDPNDDDSQEEEAAESLEFNPMNEAASYSGEKRQLPSPVKKRNYSDLSDTQPIKNKKGKARLEPF